MSDWEPISLLELQEYIDKGVSLMPENHLVFWRNIAVKPEKWIEPEHGAMGGGFWIVGVYENQVIWYNDIEEGFNISPYSDYGKIDEFKVDQYDLQHVIYQLVEV